MSIDEEMRVLDSWPGVHIDSKQSAFSMSVDACVWFVPTLSKRTIVHFSHLRRFGSPHSEGRAKS